eukprot:gene4499-4736_t
MPQEVRLALLAGFAGLAVGSAPSKCLDITDYGAVPGDTQDAGQCTANGQAIARAVAAAAGGSAGSVCVRVPHRAATAGATSTCFVTTDVDMASGVTLWIDEGAELAVCANHTARALVSVARAKNVVIAGGGTLHGRAELTIAGYSPADNRFDPWTSGPRPHIIWAEGAANLTVRGVRVRNASNWNIRLDGCDGVLIDGVDVYGDSRYPNNDGIDPESSRDVTIVDSRIDVADDGVCPKAAAQWGELRNLLVRNVSIRSGSHAIKFGSNTDADMHSILFEDVTIWGSNGGLSIQQRSNGSIFNVTWRNVSVETEYRAPRWWGNGEWATITAEPRNPGDIIGRTHDLKFIGVRARSENGGLFSGRAHGIQ